MLSSFARNGSSRRYVVEMTRRGFSDASPHKPLVDLHGIHARYANATYVAASKTGTLEKVEQELLAIKATAKSNATFAGFLANPLIGRDEKVRQLEKLLGKKTTLTTLNLMTTLAGNARLVELDKVIDTYGLLMKAKRGQIEATIISAEPLSKSQTDAVQKAVMSQMTEGKTVVISSKVDPSIIGGLQVQIGDKFLDLSVASRIDTISRIPV
jgi:F-type H+-transporting ATPase subunit O